MKLIEGWRILEVAEGTATAFCGRVLAGEGGLVTLDPQRAAEVFR